MQERFDPYQHWLGIPPAQQPPNHYCLLGIAAYESDTRLIASAIEQRKLYVHARSGGQHPEVLEDLLEDLASAKHILLNPALKQQYDAMLRGQAQAAAVPAAPLPATPPTAAAPMATPPGFHPPTPQPAATPAAVHTPSPAAAPTVTAPAAMPGVSATAAAPAVVPAIDTGNGSATQGRMAAPAAAGNGVSNAEEQKSAAVRPVLIGSTLGGLVLLAIVVMLIASSGADEAPESVAKGPAKNGSSGIMPVPENKQNRPRKPAPARPRKKPTSPSKWRNGTPHPMGSRTMGDLMQQNDNSPPDMKSTTGLLAAARMALADRQIDAARHHLEAASGMARTPTERDEVQRVEKLFSAVDGFWKAVQQRAGRLQAGEELAVGSTIVIVVDNDKDRLILRVNGRNRQYHIIDELPRQVAVALAEQRTGENSPLSNLRAGAFLAVDARGDRQKARSRLEAAGPEGKALLPELALAGPVRPSTGGTAPHSAQMPGDLSGTDGRPTAPPAVKKLPVPPLARLDQVENELREVLSQEFAGARRKDGKVALAKKLFNLGEQSDDDPAVRYYAYQTACDIAVELGDPESFLFAIDRMDRHFKIDALGMKAPRLAKAWREQTEVAARRQIYEHSKRLLDDAMRAKHTEAADDLISVAMAGAKAAKDFSLLRKLEEQAKQIDKGLR